MSDASRHKMIVPRGGTIGRGAKAPLRFQKRGKWKNMGYLHASKLLKLALLSSLTRKYVLWKGFYHNFSTKKASASGGFAPWTPEVPLPPLAPPLIVPTPIAFIGKLPSAPVVIQYIQWHCYFFCRTKMHRTTQGNYATRESNGMCHLNAQWHLAEWREEDDWAFVHSVSWIPNKGLDNTLPATVNCIYRKSL